MFFINLFLLCDYNEWLLIVGPAPGIPTNVTVEHDLTGGIVISWKAPARSAVPVLCYRVEYSIDTSTWTRHDPVLSNQTSVRFQPASEEDTNNVKYYFRVRSYGKLSYSDNSEAPHIFYPRKFIYWNVKLRNQNLLLVLVTHLVAWNSVRCVLNQFSSTWQWDKSHCSCKYIWRELSVQHRQNCVWHLFNIYT